MTDHQHATTNEILRRLEKVAAHVPEAKIRALPAFASLYDTLDTPHRLQVDAAMRERR